MELLRFQNASLAFGTHPMLDQVDFSLFVGERVCLVGRNGAGKSTMLKLLTGQQNLDDGQDGQTKQCVIKQIGTGPTSPGRRQNC